MKIFVLGLGYTGKEIARELVQAGHEVWGMNRSGEGAPEGTRGLAGDVSTGGGLAGLNTLPPVDWMVSALSGTGRRGAEYEKVVVCGPVRVVNSLRWLGARKVMFLGSTGVYGNEGGDWVNEETPPQPRHPAGAAQLRAEEALAKQTDSFCAVRLSGLYGPGRTRLIRQALRKRPWLKPDVWSNQIHRDDVARITRFLLEREAPLPRVLLASDNRPALRREIFEWIRRETGATGGWYDEDHPARSFRDRGNKRVNNTALRGVGYTFRYPTYVEGLAPLLPKRSNT